MKFLLVALLCWLPMATARAAEVTFTLADLAGEGPITQIKLQHTWCFGSCPIDELTLNADGQAEFAGHKSSARQGFYRGQIAPEKFAELTKFLQDQNFFELRPEIGRGNIDSPDTIVSVTRNNLPYAVAFRSRAKLQTGFDKAFERASAKIAWKKDEIASKSGVRGTLRRDLSASETRSYADRKFKDFPMQLTLVTLTSSTDFNVRQTTRTDQEGRFQFFAPPGRYSIQASDFNFSRPRQLVAPIWIGESLTIEIEDNQFASAALQMHDVNPDTKSVKP